MRKPKVASANRSGSREQDVLTTRWQLQTAKARFSEVFRRARAEGPQYVTRQGKDAVVIVPAEEFERLTGRTRKPRSLVAFFAESPLAGADLNLERKADYGRKVNL
jgi:antitoxin Phd